MFDAFTVSGRNMRASVKLAADALAADNTFNFVVSPIEPVHITVVDRGNAASALYLTRVLAIGDSPKFQAVVRRGDAISTTICVAARSLCSTMSRWRQRSPGDLPATSSRAVGCSLRLDHARAGLRMSTTLPATIGPPVDRTRGDAARVGALEYGHPVFEPFRAPRSGDFSAVPSTATAISLPRRDRRCSLVSMRARPRCSSAWLDAAASCSGARRSTCRGATSDQTGVSAVYSSDSASSRGLYRTGAVAHGRAGSQCVRGYGTRAGGPACRIDASGRRLPLDDEGPTCSS